MANRLRNLPLIDNFETTLSQSWNGSTGTIYVNATPTFTFPSGIKTYIVVDPGKTTMQLARISAYDATLKTMTIDSTTLNKGASVAYTAQAHSVGAVVRISDNYQFREDIRSAFNDIVFADPTARDAFFTSPIDSDTAYITSLGAWTDYIAGAWSIRATGSVVNASTTVAGKVEISTQAETEAKTATGGTGAILVPTNATINPSNITTIAPNKLDKISFSDTSASGVLGSTTIDTLPSLLQLRWGDGSDGDVTLSGAGTTTLTRDMQYNNLTITSPRILDPAGYRIFVRGTLSGTGTISRPGNTGGAGAAAGTGTAGVAATTLGQGSLNAEVASVAGGAGGAPGVVGVAGTASTLSLSNVTSVAGGAGGAGGSGGGAAAGATASSTRGSKYNTVINNISLLFHSATAQGTQFENYKGKASSSGGGGGTGNGDAGGGGGGSGGNGGVIWIAAFIYSFTGTVSAIGGAGGAGGAGALNKGGGGGGGGGNGGTFLRMYNTIPNDSTNIFTGGAGGAGGTGASGAGVNGSAGTTGATGEVISIVI